MDFFQCCNKRNEEPRKVDYGTPSKQESVVRRGMVSSFSMNPAFSSSPAKKSGSPTSLSNLCGIGIVFQAGNRLNGQGGLIVASLAVDGPADKSGQVRVGDILESIDGMDIHQLNPENLSPLILGPPGSKVLLGFSCPDSTRRMVELTRGWNLKSTVSNEKWSNPLPQNHTILQSIPSQSPQ